VIPPALAGALLIRESYLDVLAALWRLPKDFAVILTGTPGIGKSTFALFFICWLAAQQQKVLYR
jgi:KaiC/GvpD/RAD55 family RecA-like ATPase